MPRGHIVWSLGLLATFLIGLAGISNLTYLRATVIEIGAAAAVSAMTF